MNALKDMLNEAKENQISTTGIEMKDGSSALLMKTNSGEYHLVIFRPNGKGGTRLATASVEDILIVLMNAKATFDLTDVGAVKSKLIEIGYFDLKDGTAEVLTEKLFDEFGVIVEKMEA